MSNTKRRRKSNLNFKKTRARGYSSNPNFFKQLWQSFIYTFFSIVLIFFFLNNGLSLISINQVHIYGNKYFEDEEIIKASGISLPRPLLKIIPKRIEVNLKNMLSLEAVSIHRQIFSKELFIEILEREPIAYAQRNSPNGTQNGMIDEDAEWIPLNWYKKDQSEVNIFVSGWRKSHQQSIAFLLKHQKSLGSPLKEIKIGSTGELEIRTEGFDSVTLGSNAELLSAQIKVLSHLSRSLPQRLINQRGSKLDLRDLSKPELQTGNR
ncbi:cell division protein FtsQ/DivIB [Prochlorococcus sp. MIT 1223]|uniref:cell division protein FtsQ/DivIB n=1 Tax=Prochlorococcus sp. MIT 1223 TaxID=3096217 RepID=UPI002A74D363|nr:FtsQ-type POTRA domain-containing protein [Prochlorococcus sp. MIT 1223]